jgi:hypothetical protein
VRLREGQAAVGVWLPLALADLIGWLAAGTTMGATIIRRADALDAWGLPELAKAVRNDDADAEDSATVAAFERLAEMYGSKNGD